MNQVDKHINDHALDVISCDPEMIKVYKTGSGGDLMTWQVSPKANQQEINEANNLPLSDITKAAED
tara:strand:- start:95 stop:292 length:198 start_codon:yes stop_codon:yes gene_type:complete